MKTITAKQAAEQFEKYSTFAHEGEKIMVTLSGEPWVMLSPPPGLSLAKQATGILVWPDFPARLAPHYPESVEGPTATELLAEDREDRGCILP